MEAIKNAVQSFFINLPVPLWLKVMLCSMIPFIEARYAILFFLNGEYAYWHLFLLSVIGNMIPVPFIIFFFRPILGFLRRTKVFSTLAGKLEERTMKKSQQLQKYSAFGLFIFVAVPLPGTGALTGSMIAALLDMRELYALPAIFLGTITATFLTTGAMNIIQNILGFFM